MAILKLQTLWLVMFDKIGINEMCDLHLSVLDYEDFLHLSLYYCLIFTCEDQHVLCAKTIFA